MFDNVSNTQKSKLSSAGGLKISLETSNPFEKTDVKDDDTQTYRTVVLLTN